MGSHIRHHPSYSSSAVNGEENGDDSAHLVGRTGAEPIPQDLLRKYLVYSKEKVRPKLHQMDQDKVARLYADLRKESMVSGRLCLTPLPKFSCCYKFLAAMIVIIRYNYTVDRVAWLRVANTFTACTCTCTCKV